jgi:predicted nucleic acid-binding Zn ribbon protein
MSQIIAIVKEPEKSCQYCGKILHGRSDQRFCHDACRNNFNRKKRAAEKIREHENTPEILKIIKRNYEILKTLHREPLESNEGTFLPKIELSSMGFDFRFFTSTYLDKEEKTWNCLFERGYKFEDDLVVVQDFPEMAEI